MEVYVIRKKKKARMKVLISYYSSFHHHIVTVDKIYLILLPESASSHTHCQHFNLVVIVDFYHKYVKRKLLMATIN